MFKYFVLTVSCSAVLAGCANLNSVHRKHHLHGEGHTEFVDAKQRGIIVTRLDNSKATDGTKAVPLFRSCSEPAPDVFSVYALALSGSLSNNSTISEANANSQLEALMNLTSGEVGSTIERTQTINLMRESMFRTCERYLSGAIDETTMSVQAARDLRAMVGVLAIEQLTGVVRPSPTVLSGEALSVAFESNKDIMEQLKEDKEAYDNAAKTELEKEKAFNAAQKVYDDCFESSLKPDTGTSSEQLSGGQCAELKTAADAKKAEYEKAEADLMIAKEKYDATFQLSQNLSAALGKTINSWQVDAGSQGRSDQHIGAISKQVGEIVDKVLSPEAELLISCTAFMNFNKDRSQSVKNDKFIDACQRVMEDIAREKVKEENAGEQNFNQEIVRSLSSSSANQSNLNSSIPAEYRQAFDAIWEKIKGQGKQPNPDLLKEAMNNFVSISWYYESTFDEGLRLIADSQTRDELLLRMYLVFDDEDWMDFTRGVNLM